MFRAASSSLLPYWTSAAVHLGLLAALQWAFEAVPVSRWMHSGLAQIELTATMTPDEPLVPREPEVEIRLERQPEAAVEKTAEQTLPPELETPLPTSVPAAVAAPRAAVAENVPPPAQPPKRAEARLEPTIAAEASVTQPAVSGAAVDQLPQKLPANPPPAYPASALAAGHEGVVMIRVLISPHGTAEQVRLEKSSGFNALDDSAIDAVNRWRFQPARRRGQAVAYEAIVPVRFSLASRRAA